MTVALEAQARVLTGDLKEARASFSEAVQMVAVLHAEEMRDMIRMVDAYEAIGAGRSDARRLLETAFAAPRMRQFYDSFDTNPRFGATMCALALAHDVEPEFARRIIELNGYAPPPEAGTSWPWPVKITTLGRFDVEGRRTHESIHGAVRRVVRLVRAAALGEAQPDGAVRPDLPVRRNMHEGEERR